MAFLDFLKNKKEKEKAKEKKVAKVLSVPKEVKAPISKSKNEGKFSYTVIKEPHISEKGNVLAGKNQYVFRVYARANKTEIKKSVEGIYGVDVLNVNTVQIPPKKRRLGKTEGFKKAYTKAIVTIKKGQKIEIF